VSLLTYACITIQNVTVILHARKLIENVLEDVQPPVLCEKARLRPSYHSNW